MANTPMIVDEDQFKKMKAHDRDWTIYQTLGWHDKRIRKVEKMQKLISWIGIVTGSFLAAIMKLKVWD